MLIFVRCLCAVAAMLALAHCASSEERNRPTDYQGGQYYGDALHARDLKK